MTAPAKIVNVVESSPIVVAKRGAVVRVEQHRTIAVHDDRAGVVRLSGSGVDGKRGIAGRELKINQELVGLKNESNTTFTTAEPFDVAAGVNIHYNGQRLDATLDYSIVDSTTISLAIPPEDDDGLAIDYYPA